MSDVITSAVPFEHPEQTEPLDPHEINPKMASDMAYWGHHTKRPKSYAKEPEESLSPYFRLGSRFNERIALLA